MSFTINSNAKVTTLQYLANATVTPTGFQGMVRIKLYDISDTLIDSAKTISWGAPTPNIQGDYVIEMAESSIVFNVSAGTTLGYIALFGYDGTLTYEFARYTFDTTETYTNPGILTLNNAQYIHL